MRIGIIGFGKRIKILIACAAEIKAELEIKAICDKNFDVVKISLKELGITKKINFYDDPYKMLDEEKLDGIMVGTPCRFHADMASKVLEHNIALYLEKPVAINESQLQTLIEVQRNTRSETVVSFPLRLSFMVTKIKDIINQDAIGDIKHVQLVNNVPFGFRYFKLWYRRDFYSGGMFLQVASHDFDYLNYILGVKPVEIVAMECQSVFKGNMAADKKCIDCEEYGICRESMDYLEDGFGNRIPATCSFSSECDVSDTANALIKYENGVQASYSQSLIVRNNAKKRGGSIIGDKGSIDFDWFKESIDVHNYHVTETKSYIISDVNVTSGDRALIINFINVMKGKEKSLSPLCNGILNAKMCMDAKKSSKDSVFVNI